MKDLLQAFFQHKPARTALLRAKQCKHVMKRKAWLQTSPTQKPLRTSMLRKTGYDNEVMAENLIYPKMKE